MALREDRDLALMRQAGRIVALVHEALRPHLRPGTTTADLNAVAEETIRRHGATPTFLGYQGFPSAICTSRNHEVVHGLPRPDVILAGGDIISIDVGATYQGWVADSGWTYGVGPLSSAPQRLLDVTHGALIAAIAVANAGNHLGDISAAVQTYVEAHGFTVLRELTGHGIGREMHELPTILNYGNPGTGPVLRPGMTLALEPMVSAGRNWRTRLEADGWTVCTQDGSLSAHFEHTIVVTTGAAEILTSL
jgi:methionyl aminopeptidase